MKRHLSAFSVLHDRGVAIIEDLLHILTDRRLWKNRSCSSTSSTSCLPSFFPYFLPFFPVFLPSFLHAFLLSVLFFTSFLHFCTLSSFHPTIHHLSFFLSEWAVFWKINWINSEINSNCSDWISLCISMHPFKIQTDACSLSQTDQSIDWPTFGIILPLHWLDIILI